MKKDTREMFRELGYFSGLGFSVALAIFIGLFLGLFLDRWLKTAPWLMFLGFGLGIGAAARNMLLALKKSRDTK